MTSPDQKAERRPPRPDDGADEPCVLLVDGDAEFCAIAKESLRGAAGFDVTSAHSYDEAAACLGRRRFDAVVANREVRGESCIGMLRELRSSGDDTPFVVMTDTALMDVAMDAIRSGADSYAHKVGDRETFFTMLGNNLRQLVRRNRAERRREELLRAALTELSELESIISQSPVMVVAWGPGERMPVRVVSSNISQLGYTAEDFISGRVGYADIIHPDDLQRVVDEVRRDDESRDSSFRYQYRVVTRSGEVRWVDERTMVLRREGVPIGWEGVVLDVTDQKLAETRLRDLAMIVASSHDAIYGMDLEGRLTSWNDATARLYGYGAAEVIGSHVEVLVPQGRVEEERAVWARVMGGEVVEGYETFRRRKDGSIVDVSITMSPVSDESGAVVGLSAIARDISSRKRAERLLVESELKYRTLFDSGNDAIFIIDTDGIILDVNRTACEQTGRPRPELVGYHVSTITASAEWARVRSRMASVEREGSVSFESMHRTRDGREFPVEVTATLLDFAGRPAVMGVVRDITERKMAEEALRTVMASLEELESIVTTSPAVVFQWTYKDGAGRYAQFVSDNVKQFGYSPSEITSQEQSYDGLIHPDDRVTVAAELLEHHESGADSFNLIYRLVAKDGTVRWVDDRTTVVKGDKGAAVRHQGIVMDITARKQAEEALRVANDKLNLLGSITRHDVANQLGVVSGAISLLMEGTDEATTGRLLGMMQEAVSVISQQLEFAGSYQKAGSMPPEWVLVRLDLAAAMGSLDLRGVDVEGDLGNLEVWADPMFERVIYNLLDNSLRHGGKVTRIRVRAKPRGDSLVIVYEDDGAGVPADEKERIFSKGYGRNTGHGLFLCREILGITGITIRETGEKGGGSRFEIEVPRGGFRRGPGGDR